MVRFFDHWLKGIDNGVMEEPALTCFIRDYAPPEPFPRTWPGRWRSEPSFPAPGASETALWLSAGDLPLAGRLIDEPADDAGADRFPHRATTGTRTALSWGAGSPPNGLARDLRLDDALVPTYTGAPLTEAIEILGNPVAILSMEASMPVATVVARLADVAPDGTAAQVARGRAQPDPSRLAPGTDAAGARPALRGPRPAARRRVSVRAGASAPPVARLELLAGPVAIAVSGRAHRPPPGLPAGPADRPGRRGALAQPGLQDQPGRPRRDRRRRPTASHRSGGSRRTSSPAP